MLHQPLSSNISLDTYCSRRLFDRWLIRFQLLGNDNRLLNPVPVNLKGRKSVPFLLSVALVFLLIGMWGTIRLSQQPGVGVVFEASEQGLRVKEITGKGKAKQTAFTVGDLLLEVDGNPVRDKVDLDFHIQHRKIGEFIRLTLRRDAKTLNTSIPLTRQYGWFFLVVNFLAGLLAWVMGVSVFVKKPEGQVVRLYLFCSLTLSLALLVPRAGYPFGPEEISFILPSFQIIAYTFLPVLFFHFSLIFPRGEVSPQRKPLVYSGYLPSLAIIALMQIFYWESVSGNSLSSFHNFNTMFLIFRVFLVMYVLLGLSMLYRTYKRTEFIGERKKIRWIFWGIAVGTFPFIFLHTLPDILFGRSLIPEVIKSLFVLLIPISFAFSILKYRAMNVDVVINRSLVYTLLTGFLVGIYLLVAGLLGSILYRLTGYEGSLFPILATLAAAVLFTPAKNRIRVLVDKTFYRVRYDYRKAVQEFTQKVDSAFTEKELVHVLLKRIEALLAVDKSLMLFGSDRRPDLEFVACSGFSPGELDWLKKEQKNLPLDLLADGETRGAAGSTAYEEFPLLPENPVLKRFGIVLSFPMIHKGELIGLLLLGRKKSEARYSAEDVELVSLMVQEVARALQNIRMRQRVVAGQIEKEKLQELSRLKTEFISNVSHDLRTPLTAIRFSADNMQKGVYGDVSAENRKNLQMIRDNALHVSRTIDNLLTLCMSESGKLVLNKEKLPLAMVIDEALGMVKALAEKKSIHLVREEMQDMFALADKHSLLEIFLNLLDNAIKYTDQGGEVSVSVAKAEDQDFIEISVTDNGAGIPDEHLERIFERFQTVEPAGITTEKGTGIGLDIVRNLVLLHGGQVMVESPISGTGRGTRFSFTLRRG